MSRKVYNNVDGVDFAIRTDFSYISSFWDFSKESMICPVCDKFLPYVEIEKGAYLTLVLFRRPSRNGAFMNTYYTAHIDCMSPVVRFLNVCEETGAKDAHTYTSAVAWLKKHKLYD